jgi:hypothetical protein
MGRAGGRPPPPLAACRVYASDAIWSLMLILTGYFPFRVRSIMHVRLSYIQSSFAVIAYIPGADNGANRRHFLGNPTCFDAGCGKQPPRNRRIDDPASRKFVRNAIWPADGGEINPKNRKTLHNNRY